MKKLLTLALSLIMCVCCFGLIACGKDGGAEGTYKLDSITLDGVTYEIGDDAPWGGEITADVYIIELKGDNKAVVTSKMGAETVIEAEWSLDGDKLSLTAEGETSEATLKDGTITVVDEDDFSMVLKK